MTSGKTRLAGLLGWPVSHSKSPRLHSFWAASYGIDAAYLPLPVAPSDLAAVIHALPRMGFVGANVTVPHKEAVLPLLDRLEPKAQRIGAANMLAVAEDGALVGHNTDAVGFILNLQEADPAFKAGNGPIVLLGAGGAARAVIVALLDDGAQEIRLLNRTLDKAETLAAEFGRHIIPLPWSQRDEALDGANALINSTSLGMQGQASLEIRLDALPQAALVNDLVYAPLHTDLLSAAKARGHKTADGLGMLLHQARPSFAAWFGIMPELSAEIRAMIIAS
jgi:shikimate dehydrogenase